jgi:hypothetical protein
VIRLLVRLLIAVAANAVGLLAFLGLKKYLGDRRA